MSILDGIITSIEQIKTDLAQICDRVNGIDATVTHVRGEVAELKNGPAKIAVVPNVVVPDAVRSTTTTTRGGKTTS